MVGAIPGDRALVVREPWPLLGTLSNILIGKSAAAFLIVRAFGHPFATALTISASQAQIGEISFILAELGVALNMLPNDRRDLILVGAIPSIMLNPLLFAAVAWLTSLFEHRRTSSPITAAAPEAIPVTGRTNHTILVGYGRAGGRVPSDGVAR